MSGSRKISPRFYMQHIRYKAKSVEKTSKDVSTAVAALSPRFFMGHIKYTEQPQNNRYANGASDTQDLNTQALNHIPKPPAVPRLDLDQDEKEYKEHKLHKLQELLNIKNQQLKELEKVHEMYGAMGKRYERYLKEVKELEMQMHELYGDNGNQHASRLVQLQRPVPKIREKLDSCICGQASTAQKFKNTLNEIAKIERELGMDAVKAHSERSRPSRRR